MSKKKKNSKKNKEVLDTEVMETEVAVATEVETEEVTFEMTAEETEETSAEEGSDELNELDGIEADASIFLQEEEESEGFLPEATDDEAAEMEASEGADDVSVEGTELDGFESADIEEVEFVDEERLESIVESILFASDRPVSLASIKLLFKGTNIKGDKIRRALDQLAVEYAGGRRGVTLEEVPGGYQLRTKIDNMDFLKRTLKARQFKLSGPALETLSIVAYKQPCVKSDVDEIRGVESGHLLRALMEKNLVSFEGKSDLPGRPMQYGTTRKFLEIFGLRSLKELPTLSQIDELLPDGMDEQMAEEKPTLASITDSLVATDVEHVSYSSGEDELMKISNQLEEITTSSTFFEEEKRRQAEKRDLERAQNIREALAMDEPVPTRDANWLKKYDDALAAGTTLVQIKAAESAAKMAALKAGKSADSEESTEGGATEAVAEIDATGSEEMSADAELENELTAAEEAFDNDEDMEMASDDQVYADNEEGESSDEDELPFYGEADEIDGEGEAVT
ncbi:SMC-Scp complex subunit ScpB [Bdellovibrio sp. ZAP7]|uniref:SMC-Scp complex subunit ScpB n=1 Tax=Bdellovibrio sp. ZAP7 TaxID=2231053 RepID=UPI0011586953|nr:SMC-Scp complex subunit ScpB [Bdellovibrio sp. ZAP7]QDK45533.1 SMC-Scp complex subunit ScpB [Bdellovibrio sp. ZAP7]